MNGFELFYQKGLNSQSIILVSEKYFLNRQQAE